MNLEGFTKLEIVLFAGILMLIIYLYIKSFKEVVDDFRYKLKKGYIIPW